MELLRGLRGNAEAQPLLPQREWTSLQNTIFGCTEYSNRHQVKHRELRPGLGNRNTVYNHFLPITTDDVTKTLFKDVFVKSNDTDYLYVFDGNAATGTCGAPEREQ